MLMQPPRAGPGEKLAELSAEPQCLIVPEDKNQVSAAGYRLIQVRPRDDQGHAP
jgi:hypothetical protein